MNRKLTATTIENYSAPATGRIEIYDSVVPALAVRITSTGARSFVVRTRIRGRPEPVRITLGNARALKLAAAREIASDMLRACRVGIDPRERWKASAEEAARQRSSTFAVVAEEFIQQHVAMLRSKATVESGIRRHLITPWGKRPLSTITDDDVAERIRAVKATNGPHTARLVLAYAKRLFRWAAAPGRPGRIKSNPCAALSANKDFDIRITPRQVVLAENHLRLIWESSFTLGVPFGPYYRMLMLSGQRRSEVADMAWGELDLDRDRVWIIPAERMKAGRPHEVPLSPPMLELLRDLRKIRGEGAYVFSTTKGERPIAGFTKAKTALDKAVAELNAKELAEKRLTGQAAPETMLPHWQLHDIRRTVRTGLGAIPSVPHDVRELVIAHLPPALVQTYDLHAYRNEKRQALMLWAVRLERIVDPVSVKVLRKKRPLW
jgi:integrase